MSWTDYVLSFGPAIDLTLLAVGVPGAGIGTITGGIRKYINASPDGANLAYLPTIFAAGKILSTVTGLFLWLSVKRYG